MAPSSQGSEPAQYPVRLKPTNDTHHTTTNPNPNPHQPPTGGFRLRLRKGHDLGQLEDLVDCRECVGTSLSRDDDF